MKTNNVVKMLTLGLTFSLSAFVISCDKNKDTLNLADGQDIAEDAVTDSYYEDSDDLSNVALDANSSVARTDGGVKPDDQRFNCSGVVITKTLSPNSTLDRPIGTITVDFGTGCTDLKGNVRSGKIIINFDGRRYMPGSKVVSTLSNYVVNGVKMQGTRTLTNTTTSTTDAPKFTIELVGGKASFPDSTFTLRTANFTREWIRATNPLNDEFHVTGGASGTNRRGKSYVMTIKEKLVFKRNCGGLPVSGKKEIVGDGKTITIDYGTGDCDRTVTYTVGDRTITKTVDKN